jgi:monoamine oxidase
LGTRTPLLGALGRSFARGDAERADGNRPVHSRRTALRAAGATALAGAFAGAAVHPAAASGRVKVAVVGAGMAGLAAADRLRRAGADVSLFEAQHRVGGRVLSVREFLPGQAIELGGELIDTDHAAMRGLAARFALTLDDYRLDSPAVSTDLFYFGGRVVPEKEVIEAFEPVRQALLRDLATIEEGDITYRDARNAGDLDRLSIAQWLDRHGVAGVLRDLLDVAYTTEFGLDIDNQSALNLLTMIGTAERRFDVFGSSDERFHVRGGNDQIPNALASTVESHLTRDATLEAVRRTSGGRYRLTFAEGRSVRDTVADVVVLAIPLTTLRQVRLDLPLSPVQRAHIDQTEYGTNAKLMLGFGERVWRTRHGSNGSVSTDLDMQMTWETSRLLPGAQGVLTNFTGGRAGVALGSGSAAGQAARTMRDVDAVFPGAAEAQRGEPVARFHWPSNRFALGSYACPTPGWWTGLRGALSEPAGGVYFAGEHCSLDYNGFMEGAARSGVDAAEAILSATRG